MQGTNMDTKMCLKCGNPKPLTQFSPNKANKNGTKTYQPYCKECRRAHRTKKYYEERDKELEWKARYRENNREKLKGYNYTMRAELSDSYIIQLIKYNQRYYGLIGQPITQEMIDAKRDYIRECRRTGVYRRRKLEPSNQPSKIKRLIQSRCKTMGFSVDISEIRPPAIHHYRQQLIAKRQVWVDNKSQA